MVVHNTNEEKYLLKTKTNHFFIEIKGKGSGGDFVTANHPFRVKKTHRNIAAFSKY